MSAAANLSVNQIIEAIKGLSRTDQQAVLELLVDETNKYFILSDKHISILEEQKAAYESGKETSRKWPGNLDDIRNE